MDKPKDKQEDWRGEWPQRPQRPARGRGNEPGSSRDTGDGDDSSSDDLPVPTSKWTSHPTSYRVEGGNGAEGSTKETRALPIVEPSRFEAGRQNPAARTPAARPTPQPMPRQQPSQTAPPLRQPQPDYDDQPTVHRTYEQGGRQYERQDYSYDDYQQPTQQYEPQQRIAQRAQAAIPPDKKMGRRATVYGGSAPKYLTVQVEGEGEGKRRGPWWILWMLLGILVIGIVGAVAFGLAWQGQYAGKVFSGVTVLDEKLGGMTPDEAKGLLRDKVADFTRQPVTFAWRGKEWKPSGEQLGIRVDVDATVDEAYKLGRGPDAITNMSQQWFTAQGGYAIPLTVELDETALQKYLATIAEAEIDQKLFEGNIFLRGEEIVAEPGKEGRALQVYNTIVAVRGAIAKLEPARVELLVEGTQPTISAEEVGYIQGLLSVRISAPITATAPGKAFSLDREALMRFTTIERNPDRAAAQHIKLGWKENELLILSERWAKEAGRLPQNARFSWRDGSVAIKSESIDGFETDPATVVASIKEHAGTSDKREYELPGKIITPTVSSKDLPALGIRELMGTGTSTFKNSSQERATNIRVAAELLNGAVVPPGGTFSFLQTMGGIDEEHGFVEGYVIAAERTQLGVGGGVCQVSTTAFRAAFWSGVEITERNQHSYRVGWYEAGGEPVGFDAAVFDPGVDLKFVNNTSGYILVEAGVGDETLTVNLYGTRVGGEVKLEGPAISNRVPAPPDVYEVDPRLDPGSKKQVETARGGLDTTITRRIIVPGQPDRIDRYQSSYKAWPNWFVVASASQIPGGGGGGGNAPKPTPNP